VTDIEQEVPEVATWAGMSEAEQALADEVYGAVMYASRYSERSLQAGEFKVGVSDLGFCSERTRRMIDQQVPEDTDELAAFIGTAIGDHVERALAAKWDDALLGTEVSVDLEGDRGTYTIAGHPDIVRTSGLVLDVKTSRGLAIPSRTGPSLSQQFQRHLYAKGAHTAGLFGDLPLEQVRVANVWLDRAADHKEALVHMEPFNPDMLHEAARWLDDVVYSYLHDEEARKEPPREVCQATCGFFNTCRALDTDVSGLLTDPEVLTAIDLYAEGQSLTREGKILKDQASAALHGISGSNGSVTIRWTHVNGTEVAYTRKPYDRLVIGKLKA
jgi:hypothetical protein